MRKRKKQQPATTTTINAFQTNITSNEQYDLECYELDLPEVVRAKRQLLDSRLFRRRPWLLKDNYYPNLISVDFNNLEDTRSALEGILLRAPPKEDTTEDDDDDDDDATAQRSSSNISSVHNIILFEGVMIYLNEGIPHSLLELCSSVVLRAGVESNNSNNNNNTALASFSSSGQYLCFADRLENIPGGDEDAAIVEMEGTGWELLDWLPKPGLARHMGVAKLKE